MKRQLCFHLGAPERVQLSPYTDIIPLEEGKLLLRRRDTGAQVLLECSAASAINQIVAAFSEGINVSDLSELIGTKQFIEICKAKGVIE